MLTLTTKLLAAASFASALLLGASANTYADNACAPDRARLCNGARGFAMAQCMKEHEGELSPACQAQRGMMKQMAQELRMDCQPDVQRLCQGVQPGGGRIRACLASHAAELSPACQQAADQMRAYRSSLHPGCHADAQRLCQGVQPGGGRIIACLQTHANELSPVCKERLDNRLARRAGFTSAPAFSR